MLKFSRLTLITFSIIGLILVLSFDTSSNRKVEAQTNSTKLIGYAWSENIGWISFSSENVPAVEVAPALLVPAAALCIPLSPLTQTLTCPSGQTGSIIQTKVSTCPGPTYATDWSTTSNTCVTPVVWSDGGYPYQTNLEIASLFCTQVGARLPTRAELAAGMTDPNYAGMFAYGTSHWTNEVYNSTNAWFSYFYNGKVYNEYGDKTYYHSFRCYHK
jgi:hypothetical protein